MKKKFGILINIAVICLCICALAIGVYSATTAQLTVSGTIGFTAHECELDVQISKQGYAYEDDLTQYYDTPQYIDFDISEEKENTIGRLGGKQATIKGPVSLGSMNFTDLAEDTIPPIIVKVTVTNQSAYQVSGFVMIDMPENSNITYTRLYTQLCNDDIDDEKDIKDASHESAVILSANETEQDTATFTIIFNVATPDQSIDPGQAITITGDFAKYDKTLLQNELKTYDDTKNNLRYTVNTSDYASYTVKTLSNDVSDVEILSTVNNLPVTQISGAAFIDDTTLTSITIPNTVITIGKDAFCRCSNLTNIKMSNATKTIEKMAFFACSLLPEITIPSSVTKIGESAFSGASQIKKVNIESIENWYNFDFVNYRTNPIAEGGAQLYLNGVLLTKLIIPNTITEIKPYTFYNCKNPIVDFELPNSITTIGSYSFYQCSNFTSNLNLPDNVTSIGDYAFKGCSGLKGELILPNTLTYIGVYAFEGCKSFTGDLVIPEKITKINYHAFSNCTGFNGKLTLPENLTIIDTYAFYWCTGFTGGLTIPNNVESIGSYAFNHCERFNGSITIPNKVTIIKENTFAYCYGLTGDLIIHDDLTCIEKKAFYECSGLTGLSIGKNVSSIGEGAFSKCRNIAGDVIIPEGITTISKEAFSFCEKLNTITLPSTLTSIGYYAFMSCKIVRIVCKALTVPTATSAFYKNNTATNPAQITTIYVLPELVETYKTKDGWKYFAGKIDSIENMPV